jgi:hypothetical protein
MDGLLRGYFRERDHHWLHRVCELPGDRVLSKSVVEDAAFWRRLRQLLGAPGGRLAARRRALRTVAHGGGDGLRPSA